MNRNEVFVRQESKIDAGRQRLDLHAGSKLLSAYFQKDGWGFCTTTNIETLAGKERIAGETTAAYERLYEILQELANISGKNILHSFRSYNKQLQAWVFADGKGK